MTQPPNISQPPDSSSDDTEAGALNLQPVKFERIRDSGGLTVYQALIRNPSEPGTEYSLTVTAASPAEGPETTALQALLDEMQVAFSLIPAPVPEDRVTEAPDPFDAKNEVLIEPGVVTLGRDGPVGVAVAVETTTGYEKLSMIKRVIRTFYKTTVGAGKDHRWTAKGNVSQQATVIVKKGYGTVKATKPPFQNVKVRRAKYYATGTVVTVHGTIRMTYYLYGSFNPPPGVVVH